jgi:prepilin-type N-terminal cleavage/methylation domain-containing protein
MTRRDEGFSLIELLLVVAIIGIVASIAVMSVIRARSAANESAAIGSLRTITSGQIVYSTTCGRGNFATELPTLAASPPDTPVPFLPPDLTAAVMVQKSGFRIEMGPSMDAVASPDDCNGVGTFTGYYAWAEPIEFGHSGNRSFATLSPTNVIWQVYDEDAPPEPFDPPAQVVN